MKLLINTSNLYTGGGVQVALSFINELKDINLENEYHIFLSKALDIQINRDEFSNKFYFYLIETSPSKLSTRKKITNIMYSLEQEITPDIVISIFGPSYWTPKTKHVMGFAVPWVLEQNSVAYKQLKIFHNLKMKLWVKYISYYTKRNTSNYIIETQDGKNKLSKILSIDKNKIHVVSNTYSSVFDNIQNIDISSDSFINLKKKETNEFRLLLISHNYSHKNLQIINKVIPLLSNYNVKFVLTINDDDYKQLFGKENKNIINIGPIKQKSCPSLYSQCDALFLPTLLEVFSASYPEAMKMKKPILTSDLSFARDICGNAAVYFSPLNERDISNKIIELIHNSQLRESLVNNGLKRLKNFETAKSRAKKYLDICEKLIKKEKNV